MTFDFLPTEMPQIQGDGEYSPAGATSPLPEIPQMDPDFLFLFLFGPTGLCSPSHAPVDSEEEHAFVTWVRSWVCSQGRNILVLPSRP